ncbi:EAL domain-containing protein [Pelagibacterium luteolum]|uniref:Diguanylate cyclase (GGDEF) domain-containing protein n=1 Tax=Pelagibacterium luteolum TaxID=440168 RepID=A0A1G7TY93_9HYPH|nr:EAL domain-containing protein [Pelagibacterium luteolum]SDG40256.1 diguanylate cyclase (GGDEF) domain-containing protein [Pelagibacterium luteolum]
MPSSRARLFVLFAVLTLALAGLTARATAFEVVTVPDGINAVNLRAALDVLPGEDGSVQISTAPGEDGIIRRIEVISIQEGTNPNWAVFALRNESDVQIERLLVAPYFRLPGSGVLHPDLGSGRITAMTPSHGLRPERVPDREADVFDIVIDPGATVTLVVELTSDTLPELYLWEPDAYRDYINSFTLFRGVVLGIASLAAVFLTIMFVVKGRGVFPATATLAWAVLAYLLIDFGIFGPLLGVSNANIQPFRAAAEAALATALFGFLFIYLNLHRWHFRFTHIALGLSAIFIALFVYAFFNPALAAGISRSSLALIGLVGIFLILLLSIRGYDRAVLLVPTWVIFLAWLFYAWSVVTGQVSNDIAQSAVAGGLVLIVMLLGFTAIQHAFSDGQVSIGALSEVERRALAMTGSGDFVFDWNIDRDRVNVSEELAVRLGERKGALRGAIKRWLDRVHPEDRDRFRTALDTLIELKRGKINSDIRIAGFDGNFRAFRMRVKPVLGGDSQVNRIVGSLQDVTDERASRDRLLHDAVHDSLTGLPNRQLFLDRLERALVRSREFEEVKPAVFLIDLDKFTEIDERIGHMAADSLLLAVSRRLSRLLRPLDTLARISGDQFAVVLLSEQSASKIADIAEQMRKALRNPFNFGDRDMTLTASIGITIYDNKPATAEDVLRDAELAMHYAKRHGGDRIEAFRAATRSIAVYAQAMEDDLRDALERRDLQLYYQPIVDIQNDNRIIGAEALLRWQHPERGQVSPSAFVPLAERTGQIEKLGRIAFEEAAEQARVLSTTFKLPDDFYISVNMSAAQLTSESLLNDMRTLVAQHKSVARHMKLEVTESQVMTNPEHAVYMLQAFKALGLGLALDDFGTGYSSLAYLHRFPFDTIKLPAEFIQIRDDSGVSHTQIPIIAAVVGLARELDLALIAEGVETDDEIARLKSLECRYAQGFAFGAAMPGQEFARRLQAQQSKA